jgi:hypothetical protein
MTYYTKITKPFHKAPDLTNFNTSFRIFKTHFNAAIFIKRYIMRTLLLLLFNLSSIITHPLYAQSTAALNGAWKLNEGEKTHLIIIQGDTYAHTIYQGKQFLATQGGLFSTQGNTLTATILFNNTDSTKVNTSMSVPFRITGSQLILDMGGNEIPFDRVDDGKGALAGVWRITGRMGDDGKINAIHQTGTRQTLKLLTGTKFQWVAIDPAKKQFSGTGGGSYTFKDGKYTENIEFFSRDNSRVGAALVFDGKLEKGDWHHSGLSSKRAKIYEVWSPQVTQQATSVIIAPPPPMPPKGKQ